MRQHHRTHQEPQKVRFAVSVANDSGIVGVAIVGDPVARMLDDTWTAEVVRVATDGTPNACSMLYGASWRACRALGFRRAITYILSSEPGTSLRAAGWRELGRTKGGSWHRQQRPRVDMHPTQAKIRWGVGYTEDLVETKAQPPGGGR